MTPTHKAIQRAVEGGYKLSFFEGEMLQKLQDKIYPAVFCKEFLDPLFWSALGKAEGWIDSMPSTYDFNHEIPEWKHHWHRFIDHLAEGKSPDDYFKELLK